MMELAFTIVLNIAFLSNALLEKKKLIWKYTLCFSHVYLNMTQTQRARKPIIHHSICIYRIIFTTRRYHLNFEKNI